MREAIAAQVAAAAPDRSSWVAANAGSGKTRVLTDRVARLLLAGTDPARILCLTYTKAAAAEMQTRLFRTLGGWAMADDAKLVEALSDLGAAPGGGDDLDRARTLFARALETPGGLKIQTIHAFCEALLRRFPLEAGVAPEFRVLDDRQARALRDRVLDALAEDAPGAVSDVAAHLTIADVDDLLREIGHHRAAFDGAFDAGALAAALGVAPDDSVEGLAAAVLDGPAGAMLREVIAVAAASGTNDRRTALKLQAALAATDPDARLAGLEGALLTGASSGEPFTARTGSFPVKAVRATHPDLCARLDDFMKAVEAARGRRLGIAAFARSAALHRFARSWLTALDEAKARAAVLDFDDMIARTRQLLTDPAAAAWVLWKLDGGLDHILVDEAQDTSLGQWEVVRALSEEFFAGESARDGLRTLFVVGDEKQSIYGFQGADVAAFGGMRAHFEAVLSAMGDALQHCDLIHSFRSAAPVLDVVDAVFAGPAGAGLSAGVTHRAIDPDAPGRVELWPFLPKPERPDESPWDAPVDAPGTDDPVAELARRIAGRIAAALASGMAIPDRETGPRPLRAGDVMILVQRRGPVFHAVIAALKAAGVPVAGADVLRIGGELAVRDLLAVLRVAATPADDLSLASVLRSPLGGLGERALFELAHGRTSTLLAALESAPPERWPGSRRLLADLMAQAEFLRPFEMLQRILIGHDGRRLLVARLGAEAEDGIDALLDQALAFEAAEAPSLTGFLDWIDRAEVTAKRRSEATADQVRVLTVHGAKGLEAPVVILPDTAARHAGGQAPEILRGRDGAALWRMPAGEAAPLVAEAEADRRARERAENMRLLYVALTRARNWLIVCGAGTEPKPDSDAWHVLVAAAMAGLGTVHEETPQGRALVMEHDWPAVAGAGAAQTAPEPVLPDWARSPAPRRPPLPRPLAPSGLGGGHTLGAGAADAAALARGDAVHLLLEVLPGEDPAGWPALAAALLPAAGAELAGILAEAGAVLAAPECRFLFAPGTLGEVDISAPLPDFGGAAVFGRIDRLVVGDDRVLAVDFKSNRDVPGAPAVVPEAILRQLGAYRAGLAAIFPGRAIETAIVWTCGPVLMPLPCALVDAALQRARLDRLAGRT